jgi:hypothetical protein
VRKNTDRHGELRIDEKTGGGVECKKSRSRSRTSYACPFRFSRPRSAQCWLHIILSI